MRLDLDRTYAARDVIDPVFLHSPLHRTPALDAALGCRALLKIETINPVRSFKGRGTETVMSRLATAASPSGVVCASAGNLGQALAYSGVGRGVPVTVYAARSASAVKIARMRSLGATVHLHGDDIERPRELARAHADRHGAVLVEDSLDVATCEGAATIGIELLESGVDLDVVLLALGGGALASGVGFVLKQLSPATEVISVQPVGAPAMTWSWREGRVVDTARVDTIADGVAGRFPIAEVLGDLLEVLDDAVLVDEAAIAAAMRALLEHAGLVVEPSAALGVAAMLVDPERYAGRSVVSVICGSNVAPEHFRMWTAPSALTSGTAPVDVRFD